MAWLLFGDLFAQNVGIATTSRFAKLKWHFQSRNWKHQTIINSISINSKKMRHNNLPNFLIIFFTLSITNLGKGQNTISATFNWFMRFIFLISIKFTVTISFILNMVIIYNFIIHFLIHLLLLWVRNWWMNLACK